MFKLICGVILIIVGAVTINLGFKLKQSKDINLIKNSTVKIEKIKDKEGYIKFNMRINLIMGAIWVIDGIGFILSKYFVYVEGISSNLNIMTIFIVFICSYKCIFKAPKF